MKYKKMKSLTQINHILATIPVDNPAIFRGVCNDIERNRKESPAYELFAGLVKLATTCEVEVSFNAEDYDSVIVYTVDEPNKAQIASIPLIDMTIRGMLRVIDDTLDYLEYNDDKVSSTFSNIMNDANIVFGYSKF